MSANRLSTPNYEYIADLVVDSIKECNLETETEKTKIT